MAWLRLLSAAPLPMVLIAVVVFRMGPQRYLGA